jgi:hypothetical protein
MVALILFIRLYRWNEPRSSEEVRGRAAQFFKLLDMTEACSWLPMNGN